MKKIFTLIAAALVAVSVNAQTKTTIWTSDGGGGTLLEWGKANVTISNVELNAGDVITITVAKADKTIDENPQATLCTPVGTDWSWTDLLNVQTPEAGEYEYKITADMLENVASHNQIFFKGTAAYISKVEYTPSADIDPSLLWKGEHTVSWDNAVKVSSFKLLGIAVGDQISIKFSNAEEGHQCLIDYDWNKPVPGTNKGVFVDGESTWTFGITNANIDILKKNGFFVSGSKVTVTEVSLVAGEGGYSDAIWFGDIELSDSRNWAEIYGPEDAGSKKYLELVVSGTPSWKQLMNASWAKIEVDPTNSENVYTYELTADLKATLSDFIVQGSGFSLKEIRLVSTPTAISSVKAGNAVKAVRYNLAGQQVDGSYKGVVIENGKKFVVK